MGDGEMMALLRQQSAHVVAMMKDVLDRMESYPEELWALYGAVEAYEKCHENMEALSQPGRTGEEEPPESVDGLQGAPHTLEQHREALMDIYSHILEGVQTFLAVAPSWRSQLEGADGP